MVNQMIQDEAPDRTDPRQREHNVSFILERPGGHEFRVGSLRQIRARGWRLLIELFE